MQLQSPDPNKESDFMIEKIKERPINKRKLLRRTLTTASMAVVFGLIACLTFLLLEPVINHWLYPEEPPEMVELPEDTEEIPPEDMLVQDEPEDTPEGQEIKLEEEQIQQILSEVSLDVDDYRAMHASVTAYVGEINRSIVTVTGAVSNVDWFNESYESEGAVSGVLFYNNGKELLILADRSGIAKAETLTATFYNGREVPAEVKQYDSNTNLAVIAVQLDGLEDSLVQELLIAPLGTSNTRNLPGTPVVVLGSPMGVPDSVCFGMITASDTTLYMSDANYKLLYTDIFGSQNSSGVVFDLQGHVLGIITNGKTAADLRNLIAAYGISELKQIVSKMGNGIEPGYLGIMGTDVTEEANRELGVPYGAYIREIYMDSPAMLAGIQRGDVIVEVNGEMISRFADYTNTILKLQTGSTVSVKVRRQVQNEYREMSFNVTIGSEK